MLYFSVLLSTLHCGIAHGQAVGLELAGAGGLFCSAEGHAGPTLDVDSGDAAPAFVCCPFCSGLALVDLALLFVLGAWLRPPCQWQRPPPQRVASPPRERWPALNPRAP